MPADLFEPFQLGDLTLSNRMVMAPMTRNRAGENGIVPPMMAAYYQQRASAGLIVTESAPVSPRGVGYPFTPLIYSDAQAQSWRHVTEAVHSAKGHIFVQLQHCGRISHPSLLPNDAIPVAPSALRPAGQAVTYAGMQDFVTPRALDTYEIPDILAQFRRGAEMAKRAGFDGVEVHGANGYDLARAQAATRSGAADLIAFGIPFLANPDLVRRFQESLPLNQADSSTFYGGSEAGYTDYPHYRDEAA